MLTDKEILAEKNKAINDAIDLVAKAKIVLANAQRDYLILKSNIEAEWAREFVKSSSPIDRCMSREAAKRIIDGFVWALTPEGYDYWADIVCCLEN